MILAPVLVTGSKMVSIVCTSFVPVCVSLPFSFLKLHEKLDRRGWRTDDFGSCTIDRVENGVNRLCLFVSLPNVSGSLLTSQVLRKIP